MIGRLLAAIGAIGLLAAVPLRAETTPEKSPTELERAKQALVDGKPADALELVDPIITKAESDEAKDPAAICPSAASAFLIAMMGKQGANVSVSVDNDWCDAMLVRGFALTELKRFDEAAATLGKLVKHDPRNANYLCEYAFALRSSGKMDQAFDTYRQASNAASLYTDKRTKAHWRAVALRGMGYIEFDRKNWDKAEKAYRDSLKAEPGNALALSELELIKQNRGK